MRVMPAIGNRSNRSCWRAREMDEDVAALLACLEGVGRLAGEASRELSHEQKWSERKVESVVHENEWKRRWRR